MFTHTILCKGRLCYYTDNCSCYKLSVVLRTPSAAAQVAHAIATALIHCDTGAALGGPHKLLAPALFQLTFIDVGCEL